MLSLSMEIVIIILLVLLALEVKFSPRFGFTKENAILLWYGKNKRNFIILFSFD